jgi:hypothetical protein
MNGQEHASRPSGSRSRAKRLALAFAIALAATNIWTGGPAFALWVGSRAQGSGPATMSSVFVVIVVLMAVSLVLVRLIGALQRAYDECAGTGPTVRAHTPWLRSMRGERPVYPGEKPSLTGSERILITVAVVAVIALEVWFFFFSGSPIDQRSGRSEIPVQLAQAGDNGPHATWCGPQDGTKRWSGL